MQITLEQLKEIAKAGHQGCKYNDEADLIRLEKQTTR